MSETLTRPDTASDNPSDTANDNPFAAPHWQKAREAFSASLDDSLRKRYPGRVLPWERPVAAGQIDFWKVHAYALDCVDELLERVLPDRDPAYDDDTYWRGRHDERSNWISVSLFSGAWSDPRAGKRGCDLVSLVAHVYRMPMQRAALRLAQQLGVEARRG